MKIVTSVGGCKLFNMCFKEHIKFQSGTVFSKNASNFIFNYFTRYRNKNRGYIILYSTIVVEKYM